MTYIIVSKTANLLLHQKECFEKFARMVVIDDEEKRKKACKYLKETNTWNPYSMALILPSPGHYIWMNAVPNKFK